MSSRMLLIGLVSFCGSVLQAADARGQACTFGEPPSDFCPTARVIPGGPGQHIVYMDVSNATGTQQVCGQTAGSTVWFEVTPTTSGVMTISTCHPNTLYDTVIEVFEGGDPGCEFMSPVACNDDKADAECALGCAASSGRASEVTISVTALKRYRFVVGAFGDNAVGCPTCLGLIVTIDGTCGDAPRNFICEAARVLSGMPGVPGAQRVHIDVTDMPSFPEVWSNACTTATSVGSNLWFTFNAAVNGIAKFSTCNPNTTYDTVARAMVGTCGGQMARLACEDDTQSSGCTNSCGPISANASILTFPITQGTDYYVEVGSYNDNDAGCPLCLETTLEIFDCNAMDAPVAAITGPADFGCQCPNGPIVGTASQTGGAFAKYVLEYRTPNSSTWSPITTSTTPVVNGVLANWPASTLPYEWYFLRLTVVSICGPVSTDTRIVRVGGIVDAVRLDSPTPGVILGGNVCFDGTAWDQSCFDHYAVGYRPAGSTGSFTPVDPAHPTYPRTRVNQALATWNTGAQAIPDGDYEVRLTAADDCGNIGYTSTTITVDNTPPLAVIASPTPCDYVEGLVNVMGTARDPNIESWVLQVTGGNSSGWTTIATGNANQDGLLGQWNTMALPPCAYTLRLVVTDKARRNCNGAIPNRSEYMVSINVGFCGDFDVDDDNDVDLFDYNAFQSAYTGPR